MKKVLFFICAGCMVSCADKPDTTYIEDYCAIGDYQNCDLSHDAGECFPGAECENPVGDDDVYLGKFSDNTAEGSQYADGYLGIINRKCRSIGYDAYKPDYDIIAVKTTAGSPLSVRVSRANHSYLKPSVFVYALVDGFFSPILYSSYDDYGTARFTLRAPGDIFYVKISDQDNDVFGNTCPENKIKGGADYRYIVTVENGEVSEKDVGTMSSGSERTFEEKLSDLGTVHYYKVTAGPDGLEFSIQSENDVALSPLRYDTDHPEEWAWGEAKLDPMGNTQADGFVDSRYARCEGDRCVYGLAVAEYNGKITKYKLTLKAR